MQMPPCRRTISKHDREVLGWRGDHATHTLDRLANKTGNLPRRLVLDYLLHVMSTLQIAGGIGKTVRATVTITSVRVVHMDARIALEFPGPVSR